ncbi:MAG: hotdog fold thioesterase, partial [Bacteroidetes bacterium]|nr:hotdog fold thioesterase [Bacteroidota bacterium]
HVRSVTAGEVVATAAPIHLGKSTQVWSVRIEDESGRLVSICRVTMAVVPVAVASESSAAGHDR